MSFWIFFKWFSQSLQMYRYLQHVIASSSSSFLLCFVFFSLVFRISCINKCFFSAMCSLPMFSASKSFVWFPEFVRLNTTFGIIHLVCFLKLLRCCSSNVSLCVCVYHIACFTTNCLHSSKQTKKRRYTLALFFLTLVCSSCSKCLISR